MTFAHKININDAVRNLSLCSKYGRGPTFRCFTTAIEVNFERA